MCRSDSKGEPREVAGNQRVVREAENCQRIEIKYDSAMIDKDPMTLYKARQAPPQTKLQILENLKGEPMAPAKRAVSAGYPLLTSPTDYIRPKPVWCYMVAVQKPQLGSIRQLLSKGLSQTKSLRRYRYSVRMNYCLLSWDEQGDMKPKMMLHDAFAGSATRIIHRVSLLVLKIWSTTLWTSTMYHPSSIGLE